MLLGIAGINYTFLLFFTLKFCQHFSRKIVVHQIPHADCEKGNMLHLKLAFVLHSAGSLIAVQLVTLTPCVIRSCLSQTYSNCSVVCGRRNGGRKVNFGGCNI
jgi:preprotein translocase subunit SecY